MASTEERTCIFRVTAGPAETVSKLGGEKNILSKTRLETIFSLRSIAATSPKKHRIFVLLSFETVSAVPPYRPSLCANLSCISLGMNPGNRLTEDQPGLYAYDRKFCGRITEFDQLDQHLHGG